MVAAACEKDLPVASALGQKRLAVSAPVVAREAVWRAFGGETPLLACDLDEAQKQALCAAIENLKDEHAAGGTPDGGAHPQAGRCEQAGRVQLFSSRSSTAVRPF